MHIYVHANMSVWIREHTHIGRYRHSYSHSTLFYVGEIFIYMYIYMYIYTYIYMYRYI